MKKALSSFIACILLCITVIPVFHASAVQVFGEETNSNYYSYVSKSVTPSIHDNENLYAERFVSYIQPLLHSGYLDYSVDDFVNEYDELYYHKNKNGETDWVLLYALAGFPEPISVYGIIGNRVFYMGAHSPFAFGLGIYDVKSDSFYDLYTMRDYSAYDGLMEAIDNSGKGRLIGDMDNDNILSIIDATYAQRCEVHIREYPENDLVQPINDGENKLKYYSDFNRDGERNVLDVTSIQRYLIGIPCPVD